MISTDGEWVLFILSAILVVAGFMIHSKAKDDSGAGKAKVKGKIQKRCRGIGLILGLLGGVALVVTMARDWVASVLDVVGYGVAPIVLAGLILFIVLDYLGDKKMDKIALASIVAVPMFAVYGFVFLANQVPGMIGSGLSETRAEISEGLNLG